MYRKDKEITNRAEIEAVIRQARVCRLGMCAENRPYVVPLCFGYTDNILYFHMARKGQKLDILRQNSAVCFEMDRCGEAKPADLPCRWGLFYESVIGFGQAEFVEDPDEKRRALDLIMARYAGDGVFSYDDDAIRKTTVLRVQITEMTGKRAG